MSDRSSRESGGLTSDWSEPVCGCGSSARSTRGEDQSSQRDSPESRATPTFAAWDVRNGLGDEQSAPTLQSHGQSYSLNAQPVLVGMVEGGSPETTAPTLRATGDTGGRGASKPLIFSAEDSPAKTSPSREDGRDSGGNGRLSSSSSPDGLLRYLC